MVHTVKQKGFTLIELLVVFSIIAVLSTIVLASLSSISAQARNKARQSFVQQTTTALEEYYLKYGGYPPTSSLSYNCVGLATGQLCMSGYTLPNWAGYSGYDPLNSTLSEFIPATQVPIDSHLGNYDGFLYVGSNCSQTSLQTAYNGYLCQDYFMLWHLEGQTQDCSPGWRYACGTINGDYYPYNQTQCRFDKNIPGVNQC